MKLSTKLQAIAQGEGYFESALRAAYDSKTIVTSNDKAMLSRYMHGSELAADRLRLQELAIEFSKIGQ